ncbi:HAD family hydrolase [uncultured Actinomyces sp.]|uniref:HAD family hydrolase n=1 Tax=uncultured Actinomyces sp. TaxID=249061 RepID=UPI0028E3B4BF|nr:HAD family hydrolase [uncultured Actinomyces sp.]
MNEYDPGAARRSGPPADPSTGIVPSGQPLVGPAAGREADVARGSAGERVRDRTSGRPLSHDDYRAAVRSRMADLDRLSPLPAGAGRPVSVASGSDGAPDPAAELVPDERLIVALDVDGTILDVNGRVSERMMAALTRMRAYGARIVISTGRGIEAALPVARHVGLTDGWMICANGAITLRMDPAAPRGYEVADSVTFDPSDVIAVLSSAVPDGIIAVEALDGGFRVSRPFPDGELIEDQRVVPPQEMGSEPVTRVVLRAPGMAVEEFSALVAGCGLYSVEYAIGWTAWLDVAPEGVTKASALRALAARLGTGAERVVAVGDGANDIEMIRWAGVGAVMGSAPRAVRDCGDLVTGPVWHDGCAALLDAVVERTRRRSQS